MQWRFLTHNCPIDLSGDEAQYWDWSRHLDLSYYSKGPAIAYLIASKLHVWGDNYWVCVFRLVLTVGTSTCIYWLTRKLFGGDRLALGGIFAGGVVPMYAAGSALMTIDPPFFFSWALATCLARRQFWTEKMGVGCRVGFSWGLGSLTKYAMGFGCRLRFCFW